MSISGGDMETLVKTDMFKSTCDRGTPHQGPTFWSMGGVGIGVLIRKHFLFSPVVGVVARSVSLLSELNVH